MRLRLSAYVLYAASLIPALVLAQDDSESQTPVDPGYIYRLIYDQALADSVLTADESALLETLRKGLGFEEQLVESIIGDTAPPQPPGQDNSGRWTMMGQNMIWAAGLYGWGVPYVLGIEETKIIVASEMFSLGGALYLTWTYTSKTPFPEARSQMQRHGEIVGMQAGIALNYLMETEEKPAVLNLMVAVPVGAWIGDKLYHRWRPSTGQAYALALQSELGRSVTSLLHRTIDAGPTEPDYADFQGDWQAQDQAWDEYYDQRDEWSKLNNVYHLVGYPLGIYLGHKFYGDRQYSFGDAAMLTVGRATGAFYGLMTASILDLDFDEIGWRYLTTAGGVGGLIYMDRYISGYDYRFGQAAIMALGGFAGAAFGSGVGVLMEAERKPFIVLLMGGSFMGFSMTRKIVAPTPEYRAASTNDATNVSMSILPTVANGRLVPMGNLSVSW